VADLEVRTASIDDLAGVTALVEDALTRLRSLRGGASLLATIGVPEDTAAEALAAALCGAALVGVATLVAVLDEAIVGLAVLSLGPDGVDLIGVHTARALRRRRIGTSLLAAARDLATDAGTRFEALALPGDQTVKSLLEAGGFKARLLRMSADR
jgi:GNAT superfamily N-acetyltransferase